MNNRVFGPTLAVNFFTATVLATFASDRRTEMRKTPHSAANSDWQSAFPQRLHAVAFRVAMRKTDTRVIAADCTSALPLATVTATIGGVA